MATRTKYELPIRGSQLLSEDSREWHFQKPDGSAARFPKTGLNFKTHEVIRQRFANGGMAIGDLVPVETPPEPFSFTGNGVTSDPFSEEANNYTNDQLAMAMGRTNDPEMKSAIARELQNRQGVTAGIPQTGMGDVQMQDQGQVPPAGQPAQPFQNAMANPAPDMSTIGQVATSPLPTSRSSTTGQPGQPTSTTSQRPVQQQDELGRLAGEEVKAIQERARQQQFEAEANQHVIQWGIDRKQELYDKTQTDYEENQNHATQLYTDVMNAKINPREMFERQTTGQKVMAAIGMILGGPIAGMTGKNPVTDLIQKALEQDIDAQKFNLSNKRSLLNYHLQKGHDILDAGKLAMMDMTDITAGMLNRNAAQYAGPIQQQNAKILSDQVLQGTMQFRQTMAQQRQAMELQKQQIMNMEIGREYQIWQMNAKSLMVQGGHMNPVMKEYLPKEDRERIVTTPTGDYPVTGNGEDAAKTRDLQDIAGQLQSTINQMRDYKIKHSKDAVMGPRGIPIISKYTTAGKEAQDLHDQAMTLWSQLAAKGQMKANVLRLGSDQIPNMNHLNQATVDSKLHALQILKDNALMEHYRNHLLGFPGGQQGQSQGFNVRTPGE